MEFTLLWAAVTAVAAMAIGVRIWSPAGLDSPLDALLGATFAGLAGGRVAAMIFQGLNPLTNPGDLIIVRGGVDTGVAALVAIIALFLLVGRRVQKMDALAPAALIGLAGWHLGCLWRGACLGTESALPWAWAASGSDITRHPVEIYAALALLAAAFAISRFPATTLARTGAGLLLAAGIRLATEPLRLTITGGPVGWYLAGTAVGLIILVAAFIRRPRPT